MGNRTFENLITSIIEKETESLMSPDGQKVIKQLFVDVKKWKPDLTPKEWQETIQQFLAFSLLKILDESDELKSDFIGRMMESATDYIL